MADPTRGRAAVMRSTRTTRNSRRASAAAALAITAPDSHSHSHSHSDPLSVQPSNSIPRASNSLPLSSQTPVLALLSLHDRPPKASHSCPQLSPPPHSQPSSPHHSQDHPAQIALDYLELQHHLAPRSSMPTPKQVPSNSPTSLLDTFTASFLQIVLSTKNHHRHILRPGGSLSNMETISWQPLSFFKHSTWPNVTFFTWSQDDDQDTVLTFEKYNLAYFFVKTIQNPQHICNQSVCLFVRSMLIDRHSNKLKSLDQTTLEFIIQLEIQKLGIDLWKKRNKQANRLFDLKGKTRKSFADYIAMLGGQSPSGSDSSPVYVSDSISEDMFTQRCDEVSKDIASVDGNAENYASQFPLENLISSCLDLIDERYPNPINGHQAQASQTDIEESLPDNDGGFSIKSPDCSTDEEQESQSFKVETLLHRPASPARSISLNSQLQSPSLGRQSRFDDVPRAYHATTAPLSGQRGRLCKQLLNCLDSNPALFERARSRPSGPPQAASTTPPAKRGEHQPHLSKSAEQVARPDKAQPTASFSSPVKAPPRSSPKLSTLSNNKADPSRSAFRWNQTQSDASQIQFETPPSPEDEPAVNSIPRGIEQTNAQLDVAPDFLSNEPRMTPAPEGAEVEMEPAQMQGAANGLSELPAAEGPPPSSSTAPSPIPQRKSRKKPAAAEDINGTSHGPAITGSEDVDELDTSPGLPVERANRPPEKTVIVANLRIYTPEPSLSPPRNSQNRAKSIVTVAKQKPANAGNDEDDTELNPELPEGEPTSRPDTQVSKSAAQDDSADSPSHHSPPKSSTRIKRSGTTAKDGFLPPSSSDSEPEPKTTSRPARSPPLRGSGRVQGRSHRDGNDQPPGHNEDQNSSKRSRHEGDSDDSTTRKSASAKKRLRVGDEESVSNPTRRAIASGSKGPRSDKDEPNVPHIAWRASVGGQKAGDEESDLMSITSDATSSDSESEARARTRTKQRSRRFWTAEEEKLLIREVEKNYRQANCMAEILLRHGPSGYKSHTFAKRTSVMLKDKAVNLSTKWMRDGMKLSAKRKKAFARFPAKGKFVENRPEKSIGRTNRGGDGKDKTSSRSVLRTDSRDQSSCSSSENEMELQKRKSKEQPTKRRRRSGSKTTTGSSKRRMESSEEENKSEDDRGEESALKKTARETRQLKEKSAGGGGGARESVVMVVVPTLEDRERNPGGQSRLGVD